MHLDQRRLVVRHVGAHRPHDATVVDDAPEVRQRLAHVDPALAAPLELQRRRHETGAFAFLVEFARGLLACEGLERGFGVEGIDVRRPAVHEEENDPLGPRPEVRRGQGAGAEDGLWTEQTGKAEHTEPGAHAPEHLPAGEER